MADFCRYTVATDSWLHCMMVDESPYPTGHGEKK